MTTESASSQNDGNGLLLDTKYIPDFVRKKCEVELNETPEKKELCIQELREILTTEKTTKDICFQEDFLVQYLRHSKYDTNKAFHHIRNMVALRRTEADMFGSLPDEYFFTKPSTKFITVLPKRCPDGCTLVQLQIGKWDPSELSIGDFKKIIFCTCIQLLRDPMAQINGFKFIHDFAGTRLEHLKYCTPHNLYLFYYVSTLCLPGRWKEIHLLNETPVMKFLWSIIKRFLSENIRKRVFIHSDTKELLDYFPKSVLPAQYGGEIPEIYTNDFVRKANEEQAKNTMEGQPNFY